MFLALKEMKKEKLRFIMIIVVTVLIAYLVYFLSSLAFGLAQINRTAVDYWNAEGVVLSKEANGNIYASSIEESDLNSLNFVLDDSINVQSTTVYWNDSEDPINLVFIGTEDNNEKIQAPLVEGRIVEKMHEIVISSNFKEEIDIKLGDTIKVPKIGREFEVVGFTKNSNYNTVPAAYVRKEMASQAMMIYTTNNPEIDAMATPTPNMPNRVSAVVLYDDVSQDVLDEYGLVFIPINEFINNLPGYQAQVLTFGLMIVSLALISSIIIGIFMYILTMQKKSIFGILKIQGYHNSYIMGSVIIQTFILTLGGFLIGLSLTLLTVRFLPSAVPVAVFWPLFTMVTLFSLVCSMVGALFSARSILKIDPLEAL